VTWLAFRHTVNVFLFTYFALQKLKMNNVRAKHDYVDVNDVGKLDDDDDDEYDFVNSPATQSILPSQIDVAKKLADGKFAVVRAGVMTVNNENRPVAVKMLKRTFV